MSKEDNNIPTQEEYIAQQIAAKKAAALDKSRTRNLPAYPLKNNILPEEEWLVNLTKKLQAVNNSSVPEWLKNMQRASIDAERNAGYYNYVGSNCIGPTCTKTAGDNYGIDVIGSQQFRENPGQYGFKQIDNKQVKPGDIVIDVENGKGRHTMMLDSNGKEGLRFNHSNGGFGPENIRKGARYPFKGQMESYTYTGTPADSIQWANQYKQIYGMAKGGIFDIPYLKKGSGIHIKKENRGKFTDYCGGKVTNECIQKAKKSKNPTLRKRATFAQNARRWSRKHQAGGPIEYLGPTYAEIQEHWKKKDPVAYNIHQMRTGRRRGEFIYYTDSEGKQVRMSAGIGLSGTDPVARDVVLGVIMGKPLQLAGNAVLHGLGRLGNNWARAKLISREMQNITTPNYTPPLNVGWGPKQTIKVTHATDSEEPLQLFFDKRWDVINGKANPFGVWYQGKLGQPRTIATNSLPGKAEKAEKARKIFENRKYKHEGEITLEKPLTTVGEVPNRSALSYDAEKMGADGVIYNNVYDNGFDNNQVIFSYRLHR